MRHVAVLRYGIVVLLIVVGASRCTMARQPNVLLIAIDDLRVPWNCEVLPDAETPALDALAARGRSFSHHYVHVPTCGASRCALLRGRHPDQPAHLNNDAIRRTHSDWAGESLPAVLKSQGYRTYALGKITHYPGGLTGGNWDRDPEELPGVWDRCWIPETPWVSAKSMMHGYANGVARAPGVSPPAESFDGPDAAYPDAWVADEAIRHLADPANDDGPWFFAVGFFKPHLPFAAPKRWFDRYEGAAFPEPSAAAKPAGVSSWHNSGEFRGNYGHSGNDPAANLQYAVSIRRSYAAALSYMDAQLGRFIAAVDATGAADNTIIIVWSDHGFLLGEHAIWGKHCLYEEALRSPLIVIAPVVRDPGTSCHAIVETVDVFPTIADLCGVDVTAQLSGRSLMPFLIDPEHPSLKPALSFRSPQQRTVRTDRWRLILHTQKSGQPAGAELFDYVRDPLETMNLADQHPEIVQELAQQIPAI